VISYDGVASSFDRIGVRPVHAQGLTGQGVTVAIIDDGIDFRDPALQEKEVPGGGIDAIRSWLITEEDAIRDVHGTIVGQRYPIEPSGHNSDAPPTYRAEEWIFAPTDEIAVYSGVMIRVRPNSRFSANLYSNGEHGTGMAKILAGSLNTLNNLGMASHARLIPYSSESSGSYTRHLVHALSLGAKIANISLQDLTLRYFGWGGVPMFSILQDILLVVIAGNGGSDHPTRMESEHTAPFDTEYGNVIVTVAVDESNHLTSASSRCGHTQRFCIAAPAVGPTSPTAPIVSGAAALLMEAVPGRPIRDYANAILETATPLGSPEETGRGLLNVDAALRYLRAH
jgi:subtilisin family serine protease